MFCHVTHLGEHIDHAVCVGGGLFITNIILKHIEKNRFQNIEIVKQMNEW